MKKIIYTLAFFIGMLFTHQAQAQVSVSINIGSQPNWGPSGYDYARYYYMPEYDMYYDVPSRVYVYYDNGWVRRRSLPSRFRHVNLYRTHKVVINDRNPWRSHDRYRREYAGYSRSYNRQVAIRDSRREPRRSFSYQNERRVERNYERRSEHYRMQRNDRHRGEGGNSQGRGNGHGRWHRD